MESAPCRHHASDFEAGESSPMCARCRCRILLRSDPGSAADEQPREAVWLPCGDMASDVRLACRQHQESLCALRRLQQLPGTSEKQVSVLLDQERHLEDDLTMWREQLARWQGRVAEWLDAAREEQLPQPSHAYRGSGIGAGAVPGRAASPVRPQQPPSVAVPELQRQQRCEDVFDV
eukprot:TRINITY_DN78374_c0_g1_i1.p1 TRINITY_DN78374_c0_g1~~TRINITY_DN78374_c0_g1_i1.p1  ORF type:complete len:177 (+),score=42.88 TRINITY_DN78374_c0_g1_i1:17-547(+)